MHRTTTILALGVLLCASQAAWSQTPTLQLKQLKPDLYILQAPLTGADGPNIAFYVTPEGVILVDDRFEQNHEEVAGYIRSVTSQPIRYVLLTHRHGDKIVAKGDVAAVPMIAQANARKNMSEGNKDGLPAMVFSDEMDLFLGGKQVRILHYGRAHTDGDAVIYFPEAHAIHVGDLMAGTDGVSNPVADTLHGGTISAWPETLSEVLKLDFDTVIPGTGIAVTTKAALAAHRDKIQSIVDRVRSMLRDRKPPEEIRAALQNEFSFKPINFRYFDGMLAELKP